MRARAWVWVLAEGVAGCASVGVGVGAGPGAGRVHGCGCVCWPGATECRSFALMWLLAVGEMFVACKRMRVARER